MKIKSAAGIFLFFITLGFTAAGSYPYRIYTVDDGLSSNIVYDIIQDNKGFIWFATSAGVCRFDGKKFHRIDINEAITDNEVLKIKIDRENRLWLLHFNGTISIIQDGKVCTATQYPVLKKIGPGFFYYNMFPDAAGNIWLTSRGDKGCRIQLPDKVEFMPKDSSVFFHSKKGYWHMHKTLEQNITNMPATPDNFPPGTRLITWDYAGDSLIFLLTSSGIFSIHRDNTISRYLLNETFTNSTTDMYCDDDLGLWICKPNGGAYYYEKTKDGYRQFDVFFKNEYVSSTFRDKEGNVWFAIHGGGVIMMPWNFRSVRSYTREDGLTDNEVYSVYADSKNRLWFGHKYGMIDYLESGKIHQIRLFNAADNLGRVLKIAEHPNGYMAFSGDNGISVLQLGDPAHKLIPVSLDVQDSDFSFSQPIKDFSFNKAGDLYIVTHEGLQFVAAKDIISGRYVASRLPLPRKRYYSICHDQQQDIYYSDFDGLMKYNLGKSISYAERDSLLKKRIVSMCEFKGNIFLSVLGYGLVVLKDGSPLMHLTMEDGLLSNHCSRLLNAGEKLLVCTNMGLNIIHQKEKDQYKIDPVTSSEGLLSSQVNDVFEKDNIIYAATLKGVSEIHLGHNTRVGQQPKIYFTEISWQGKDITKEANPRISYVDKYLRFGYISPYFTNPEGVVYQYRLNNGEWISTQNTTLEFNSLSPGDYNLHIRARHLGSEWSSILEYPFIILQPFYKSPWFFLILFILVITFFILLYAYRVRHLQKEQALTIMYEQNINMLKTQALQAMINPHFIFNSLSAIQLQINAGDSVKAGSYLSRFAKLLRMNLDTIDENYIALSKEVERITLYLESEKMRLEEKLDYEIFIGKDIYPDALMIPSMILQPIVENAIWHGLMPVGSGKVKIEFEGINESLRIQISDNGIGINRSQKNINTKNNRRHFGINLTRERLAILEKKLGKPVTFSITDLSTEGNSGTRATIILPFIFES